MQRPRRRSRADYSLPRPSYRVEPKDRSKSLISRVNPDREITAQDKLEFEQVFKVNPQPGKDTIRQLSQKLVIYEEYVERWFHLRRMREALARKHEQSVTRPAHRGEINDQTRSLRSQIRPRRDVNSIDEQELEQVFKRNREPERDEIHRLAKKLVISESCLVRWFHQRRGKEARMALEADKKVQLPALRPNQDFTPNEEKELERFYVNKGNATLDDMIEFSDRFKVNLGIVKRWFDRRRAMYRRDNWHLFDSKKK